MNKVIYFNELFTIYKKLLTNKESEYFSLYYEENLSMSEIAQLKKVSRSVVGKKIKTVENKLINYENILGKYKIEDALRKLLNEVSPEIKTKIIAILEEE